MSRSKMSHAIALAIGLSAVSLQVSAQTHISGNSTSPINAGTGNSVIVDPNVTVTVNRMSTTDISGNPNYSGHGASISGTGSVAMSSGSQLNFDSAGMGGVNHAVNVASGGFNTTGAVISAAGSFSDAVHMAGGGASVSLTNTNASAQGVQGRALTLVGGTAGAGAGNAATVSGGFLSSAQSEAVLMMNDNATVAGTNAVHMSGGAGMANQLTASASTLTGASGSALLMDGAAGNATLTGSVATNTASGVAAVSVIGAGNRLDVQNGFLTSIGAGSAALNVSGGTAILVGSTLNTSGVNAAAVTVAAGATVNLTGVNLRTSGAGAHAVRITAGAPSTVVIDGSTLSTQDARADIIRADGGTADVTIRNGANINTSGNLLNLQSSGGVASVVRLVADGVNLKGNLISDSASTGRVFLQNGTTLTGMIDPMSLTIDGTSAWNVTADSDLTSLTLNGGTVNFLAPVGNAFKTIVTGSLDGTAGQLSMNTKLGDSASPTDFLHVTGDASGAHFLTIKNAGGKGAKTRGDGIRVVQIDGASPADNFKLAGGPLDAGAYEYFLNQGGQNRPSDWYLRSTFRAAVPGYMMTPGLNRDYGYAVIGSLQERIGDFGNLARAEHKTQEGNGVWGRIQGSQFNLDTHDNLSTSAHTTLMQFGKDWTLVSNPDGSSTHAGATVTLGETNARFYDELRTVLKAPNGNNTGDVRTRAYSAGGYWTGYQADGSYLDLNGQLTWYQNNYKDIYARTAANKAVGAALSAEVGKPFAVGGSSLRVEPQAQVIYQYLNSKSFSDYMSTISVNGNHGVRGRVGVRLFREMADGDEPRAAAPYLTLDLLRNFLNPATVTVGDDALQANANKTWGEIGTGITGRVSKQGQLSAALKYRHQLSGQGNEGVAGQVGYRYNW